MQKSNFEGKFLSKLSKIDRQEIEGFLAHLVREKNFLEIIFNAMIDGIIVLRPDMRVLYANNATLDLLGVAPQRRIVGERAADLCSNRQFRQLISRFALNREPVANAEFEVTGHAERVLSLSIIPLEADTGHNEGSVIVILRDITETRRAEQERRRIERVAAFNMLAAGLAHEIKNPLNSLQIHAQLLDRALREKNQKKVDRTRAAQSSEIVLEEIQRLGRVVNDFLTAVRPTRPLTERANINTLVERVIATLQPEADERRVALMHALDHEVPLAEFDPNQMTQAVLNLVKNALDAVEGEENARVEIRTGLRDADFFVRVTDNGRGIPEDELKKVFEPYFTTKFSGTGLGLAIVSRIVEEHGGRVDVFSHPGQGTAVTLLFPLESRPVRLIGNEPGGR